MKFRGFIKLALRNLAGNEPRSWLLGVCACCIAAVAVTTVLVVHGAQESLHLAASRLGADVVVVPRGAQTQIDGALLMGTVSQTWMPSANVARIAAVRGVAVASPQIYLESLSHASCCAVSRMFIVAYDPRTDFTVAPWLHRGLSSELGLEQAVGGCDVSVPVDHNIMLYGYTMWLRGRLEPTGTNLDRSLFITLPTADAMARSSLTTAVRPLLIPKDSVSSVMVKVRPGEDPATVARTITEVVPGVTAIASPRMFASYRSQIGDLLRVMLVVLGLLLALAVVVTAALFAMAAHERRRELGVLRALGATRAPCSCRSSPRRSSWRSPAAWPAPSWPRSASVCSIRCSSRPSASPSCSLVRPARRRDRAGTRPGARCGRRGSCAAGPAHQPTGAGGLHARVNR